jgi:NAD dependent epimerase/dehydratase family enzyme
MRDLRSAWGIGFGLPAAGWMLALGALLMRTETQHVLRSHRVIPGRLLAAGFQFQFPSWPEAAQDLVTRFRKLT